MFVHRAADHRHADAFCDLVAHLREARARHKKGHAHLCGFDHHLARESSGRIENFVATSHAVEPHHAGDRVDRVVAPDIFDEVKEFRRETEQGTAVYRACLLVNRFVFAHEFGECIERALFQLHVGWQGDVVNVRHQIAEHRAAAAAGGLRAVLHFFVEINEPGARIDGRCVDLPIHLHGYDFFNVVNEALIAQVTKHQGFGRSTERHECEYFALVDVDRQRMFARHSRHSRGAMFVARRDVKGGRPRGVGELRTVSCWWFWSRVRRHAFMLASTYESIAPWKQLYALNDCYAVVPGVNIRKSISQ